MLTNQMNIYENSSENFALLSVYVKPFCLKIYDNNMYKNIIILMTLWKCSQDLNNLYQYKIT